MEFFVDNLWVLWLVVAAVMLLIEISTAALVSIWFVFGAVVTAVIASFWDNFIAQVILFFVFSGVFLGRDSKELNYSLIGKTASVVEKVTQYGGKVIVGDVYWRAVCETGTEIPEGTVVVVIEEDGTTLKVKTK